jgi:uncharacterized protein YecA (UPF0149 family)
MDSSILDGVIASIVRPPKTIVPGERPPRVRDMDKVGRNDPCPCGLGKEFKPCHGSAGRVQ